MAVFLRRSTVSWESDASAASDSSLSAVPWNWKSTSTALLAVESQRTVPPSDSIFAMASAGGAARAGEVQTKVMAQTISTPFEPTFNFTRSTP